MAPGAAERPKADAGEPDSALRARIEPLVRDGWAGAVSVAIVTKTAIDFASVGEARPGIAAGPDTPFEIGSITKTFTALALAAMAEEAAVTFETPVAELLGAKVPAKGGRAITLVDLATHTSGLPRLPAPFEPKDPRDPYADYDDAKLLGFLASHELSRIPGERYEYSNLGAGLLGHALGKRAGTTFAALVRTRITGPLGMTTTDDATPAIGHDADGNAVPPWTFAALAGAGAMRSTARDLARYVRAHLTPASVEPAALARAIAATHVRRHDAGPGGIALGWHLRADGTYWHNGETGGSHGFVAFDPGAGVGIVILASGATNVIDAVGLELLAHAKGQRAIGSSIPPTVRLDPSVLDRYVGTYRVDPSFAIAVTRIGERLFAQATGQPRLGLYAEAEDRFYLRAVEAKVVFRHDALVLQQSGSETVARREVP
jgi:CubicO group peptidase (beta-lactamase class C family)